MRTRRTRSSRPATISRGPSCSPASAAPSSSICRAPTIISRRAITPRCSPRRAAIASSRASRRCSNCASTSSTSRRCPILQEALNIAAHRAHADETTTFDLLFCFGLTQDPRFEAFGRLLFDWYRCPAMEVTITPGKRWKIDRLRARPLAKLGPEEAAFFRAALHQHTERDWRNPRARTVAKYSLAVLLRSAGGTAALLGRDAALFPEARRAAFGRGRAAHQAPTGGAGRVRRAVHSRDDLDRQLHLPLRAPRACRRACRSSTIRSR